MNVRKNLTLLWFSTLLILGFVLALVVGRYALPRSERVDIGRLSDFPPAPYPYRTKGPVILYIVNDGKEVFALDPLNPVQPGYLVSWVSDLAVFRDPLRRTAFDLNGNPVLVPGIRAPLEAQGLTRYPIIIEGDRLSFERHPRGIP